MSRTISTAHSSRCHCYWLHWDNQGSSRHSPGILWDGQVEQAGECDHPVIETGIALFGALALYSDAFFNWNKADIRSAVIPERLRKTTGCFLMNDRKYELTVSARRLLSTWDRCQKFDILGTFWYLAFKISQKMFLVKIELCGKIVRISNLIEKTKKNLINLPDWFYFFTLISRPFIIESSCFTRWRGMKKIKK